MMKPIRSVSVATTKAKANRAAPHLRGAAGVEGTGPASGGPVGAMQAELNARLTAAEYERWLLPPEPRDAIERAVHLLSLAAGIFALACGGALVWLIV